MLAGAAARPHGRSVLISGASIAGPALAYWLGRYGFRPVVVERAPELRGGGQAVDLEGAAQNVTRLMGLEGAIRARHTGEAGWRFVDVHGRTRAAFNAGTGDGPTKDLEILRGDLAGLLYEWTRHDTEYVFGNTIEALHDHGGGVTVSFAHGPDRDFDVVVGADGARSRTRSLFLGGEDGCSDAEVMRPLGVYFAYFTIPKGQGDGEWAEWCNVPGSRVMFLRPDNVGTTKATLCFMSGPQGLELLEPAEQKEAVARTFVGAGWEADRIVEGMMGSRDFHLDWLAQVHAPRWSKGRCAVVGDAACCPTPLTGMGTSLAVLGSYLLAGELARHASVEEGLAAYEAVLRPYAQQAQHLMPGIPRLAYPKTALGVNVFNAVMATIASSVAIRRRLFGGRQVDGPSSSSSSENGVVADKYGFQLPDYSAYYVSSAEDGSRNSLKGK